MTIKYKKQCSSAQK